MLLRATVLIPTILWASHCTSIPAGFLPGDGQRLVHRFSQTTFPEGIGAFQRVGARTYDRHGFDVSVGYNLKDPIPMTVTHYVYPPFDYGRRITLSDHWNAYKQQITKSHPDASAIAEFNLDIRGLPARMARFEYNTAFAYENQQVISYLYLMENQNWFLKLRITTPIVFKDRAEAAIQEYLRSMPLPTRPLQVDN